LAHARSAQNICALGRARLRFAGPAGEAMGICHSQVQAPVETTAQKRSGGALPEGPSDEASHVAVVPTGRSALCRRQAGSMCSKGCGRYAFGKFDSCCARCNGGGRHSQDCEQKQLRGFCGGGCGRRANVGEDGKVFRACCKSCSHLRGECGHCGHDAECDIRDNGGTCPPWYWTSSVGWQEDGPPFHREVSGEYVKSMGTKLLQKTMPDRAVVRCDRIEDSSLWDRYTQKRAEIRARGARIEDVQPETSDLLGFSATTTLDSSVNEVWLFHGTDETAARAIARSNFKMPSSAGNFGKGAYFAEAAQKSDRYAKKAAGDSGPELADSKVILLCRVVLGNIKEVEGTDSRAERLVQDPLVDSVLGKTDFREFLVYDAAQIYPEYIMWYR